LVDTNLRQDQINQEISNDFRKKQAALASIRPVLRDGRIGLRINADGDHSPVPEVPRVATRIVEGAAYAVPDRSESSLSQDCERLRMDALLTTWMVLEFQKWHDLQKSAWQQQWLDQGQQGSP
jgi:hypothetical protein